jgi:hypothetical protein
MSIVALISKKPVDRRSLYSAGNFNLYSERALRTPVLVGAIRGIQGNRSPPSSGPVGLRFGRVDGDFYQLVNSDGSAGS